LGFYLLRSVKAFHQSSAKKRINKSTICPPILAKCSIFFFENASAMDYDHHQALQNCLFYESSI